MHATRRICDCVPQATAKQEDIGREGKLCISEVSLSMQSYTQPDCEKERKARKWVDALTL